MNLSHGVECTQLHIDLVEHPAKPSTEGLVVAQSENAIDVPIVKSSREGLCVSDLLVHKKPESSE